MIIVIVLPIKNTIIWKNLNWRVVNYITLSQQQGIQKMERIYGSMAPTKKSLE